MSNTTVLVAAGSNVAPLANLRRALDVLDRHFAPLTVSRAYANAAVGFDGDDFINLVAGFQTGLTVQPLGANVGYLGVDASSVPEGVG